MRKEDSQFFCHPDPSAQVTRCRNKSGMTCWRGFTLAEVLITLGIIGIVAAVTMPALISDYQKKVNETAAMAFENRLEQALQQMNIAEDLTGHTSTKQFLDTLKKYMKIIKTCEAGKLEPCFAENVNEFKSAELEFMGTKTWGTSVEAFVLQNGTTALIKYNPGCTSPGIAAKGEELRKCIAITYDTNGLKKPNQVGKDVGGNANFLIDMGTFKMTAGDIPYEPIDTTLPENAKWDTRSTGAFAKTNYWAGAKKACADLGLELPKGYGADTSDSGWCDGRVFSGTAPSKTSQACKIYDWCENNACFDYYWLATAALPPRSQYSAHAIVTSDGAVNNYWVNGTSNNIIPKTRCVE